MVSMDEVRDVGVRCGVLPAGAAGSGMCLVCGMDRHRVMHRVEGRETLGKRSHYRISFIVWRVTSRSRNANRRCGIAKYVYDHTHVRLQALHIKPRTRAVRSPQSGLVSHIDIRTRAHSRLGDRRPPQPSCTPMVSSPMVRSVVIGPTCAHTTPSLSASGNSTSSSPCPSRARPARAAQAAAWSAAPRAPPQTPRTPPPSSNAPP